MSAKSRSSLTLGIILCVIGLAIAAGPGAAFVAGGIARGWPLLVIGLGAVLLASFAISRKPRSPFWGGTLVAVGGLMLAFTTLTTGGPLQIYARWWPLLIGVLAVSEVLRYYTHRLDMGPRPPLATPAKLVMAGAIAISGFTAGRLVEANPALLGGMHMPAFVLETRDSLFGSDFEFSPVVASGTLPAGGALELSNRFGEIQISQASGSQVEVSLTPTVRAFDRGVASTVVAALNVRLEQMGDGLVLRTDNDALPQRVTTDISVKVPKGTSLVVSSANGDVSVSALDLGTGQLHLEVNHGDVKLDRVNGAVLYKGAHSDIRVDGGEGPLTITAPQTEVKVDSHRGDLKFTGVDDVSVTRLVAAKVSIIDINHSRVTLGDISGIDGPVDVSLSGAHSRFSLTDIKGNVRLEAAHAEFAANRITGDLTLNGEHTEVKVVGVGAVTLVTSYDSVKVVDPTGPVDITNQHGRIDLRLPSGPSYAISDSVVHGDAEIDDDLATAAPGGAAIPIKLETSYEDIVVKSSATRIAVESDS